MRRGAGAVRWSSVWSSLPLVGWLVWFMLIPLGFVALYSFWERGPYGNILQTFTLANYVRATDGLYLQIFARSLGLAAATTGICAVLGYPLAYAMATARPQLRPILVALLMLPFLTNFVVRVYATRLLLGPEGPLAALAIAMRLDPLNLNDTLTAVTIGLITNYLPFMVLPIYVVIERFDFTLLDAAHDLGAHGAGLVMRVLLPLTRDGILAGAALTFVPALGEFMIPDLLGGARTVLLGNLITEQFVKARDWPFGAALAMLLIATMAVFFLVQTRLNRTNREATHGGA